MKSKLGRALACATLSAVLVAAAAWLPGASADQPANRKEPEFVSDTKGSPTRTAVTGQCVRTGIPEAGSTVPGCLGAQAETAKAATPVVPAQAETAQAATPAVPAQPTPEPVADFVPIPEPADMVPVPPMESVAEDDGLSAPVAFDEEQHASADASQAEELAATQAAMAREAEAEAAATPATAPEPPASVAEAPPPSMPAAAPETQLAPPPPPAQPEPRRLRLAADTYFHFDRAQLTEAGAAEIDKLVGDIGAAKIGAITIVGYTDRIGPDAYNRKLSQRRADSVMQYLASHSVEANRMQAIGRGKSDPVTTPDACKAMKGKRLIQCLAPDRRVEIEVVGLAAPAR